MLSGPARFLSGLASESWNGKVKEKRKPRTLLFSIIKISSPLIKMNAEVQCARSLTGECVTDGGGDSISAEGNSSCQVSRGFVRGSRLIDPPCVTL